MPPRLTVETEIYASHHQFYVVDAESDYRADLVWDGRGLERHIGVADGIVAVGTIGYTFLPVSVEVWDEAPALDVDGWDHVGEASLRVGFGRLGLHGVEGPADMAPLDVTPGWYRVRSSAAGLDGADEMEGGDRYRVQIWRAPAAEPEVLRWWRSWDPREATARRTTEAAGRVILGAEAHDRHKEMEWLASRGYQHLFRDAGGTLWEQSSLPDASGTPQLEELDEAEAVRRYGAPDEWGAPALVRPTTGRTLTSIWQAWRYSRGWRPPPER